MSSPGSAPWSTPVSPGTRSIWCGPTATWRWLVRSSQRTYWVRISPPVGFAFGRGRDSHEQIEIVQHVSHGDWMPRGECHHFTVRVDRGGSALLQPGSLLVQADAGDLTRHSIEDEHVREQVDVVHPGPAVSAAGHVGCLGLKRDESAVGRDCGVDARAVRGAAARAAADQSDGARLDVVQEDV